MSSKRWCTFLLILWTIANGPSPTVGSGRGEDKAIVNEVTLEEAKNSTEDGGNSGSRNDSGGLRKSTSSVSDIVIVKSSLGGDEKFSRVRRIKRETSTGFLKVHLSGGSYVYRPAANTDSEVAQNVSKELTRIARAFADNSKKSGGYSSSKSKGGYGYQKPTPPPPERRLTTEENDSQFLATERPLGQTPSASARTTTTTTEDPIDVRDNIPGEPGKDYQALASIPKTAFTCEGRAPGFYADVEAGCQVFHRCTDDPWYTGQVRVIMDSFLCPNGSLFNQQIFACDWWGNTDCKSSEEFFELNQQIGQLEETDAGTVQYVKFTGIRVPSPPGTKKVAPGIVPKSERTPLPAQYKSKRVKDGKNSRENGRPLESDFSADDELEREFISSQDNDFRPLSAQIESAEDEKLGSSQTVDEVKVKKLKSRKSKKPKTTTPPPQSSESEESDEETQEPSAATNSQTRPLVVNRGRERDENKEAQTPAENLLPPEFEGDPVTRDGDDDRNRDSGTTTPSSRPQNASPRQGQDYLPPRDEYLPPKDTGYKYSKPDNPLKLPGDGKDYLPPKSGNEYLPPKGGEYLSGTSPSTNQYLPPTTQRPGGDYLPPRNTYSSPGGLHTYSSTADSYFRKPSSGYGTPSSNSYLPPNSPSREYGQPNNNYPPPNRDYGTPNQNQQSRDYLPPNRDYGTPNQQSQSRDYLPPKKDTYGPPNKEYGTPNRENNGQYLPPSSNQGYQNSQNNNYLPPSKDYGTPNQGNSRDYLPPNRQNNEYLPPNKDGQRNEYPPPKPEYIPPIQPPSYNYGTPQTGSGYTFYPHQTTITEHWPANSKIQFDGPSLFESLNNNYAPTLIYGSPPTPGSHYDGTVRTGYNQGQQHQSNSYLPPGDSYAPPSSPGYNSGYSQQQRPSDGYLPPNQQKPGDSYLPPNQQKQGNTYLPPQKPNGDYGPPRSGYDQQQRPNGDYGLPQRPGGDYGPPQKPSGDYGTPQRPNNDYGLPQRPNGDYGTPQRPDGNYGTPQRPDGNYGTPQRPSGDYGTPQRPDGNYGPPRGGDGYQQPQRPNGDYGLPQKPGGDYGPPQRPNGDYGPPGSGNNYPSPQKPGGDYGLPERGSPANQYLPPPKPGGDYGPPRPGNDYLPPSQQKPDKDYGLPRRPDDSYLPPQNPENDYLPPRDNSAYNQISQPPREYGGPTTGGYSTLPDHILKDYNPSASPTPPTSYSTIPEQTPPPIYDSGQQTTGNGLYTIQAPKIDIVSVPLVSYHSHVVTNPILEFPPFKKR